MAYSLKHPTGIRNTEELRQWVEEELKYIAQEFALVEQDLAVFGDSFKFIENYGAIGDGVVDDTAAVIRAFDAAVADGFQLLGGGSNKTYRIVGRGPQYTDEVVNFDGRGCTFQCEALPASSNPGDSATFGFYDSGPNGVPLGTGGVTTTITANIVAGDTFLTVNSAARFVVGGLVFIRVTFAATGNPGGWVAKIRGIVGNVIEMETPTPVGSDAAVGTDTMTATYMVGATGGFFANCKFDGAGCTNKWPVPLYVQGNVGGRFRDLSFTNWYGSGATSVNGGGGPYWEACYAPMVDNIDTRKSGSAAIASITTVGVTHGKFTGINSFDSGFGPEWAWGAYSSYAISRSVVAQGRGYKTQGSFQCDYISMFVNQATSNGLGLTLGADYNSYSGLHLTGNNGPFGGSNLWVEGDSNFNRITNFVLGRHTVGQADIADSSAGNAYVNGIVGGLSTADLSFTGTKTQLENVNAAVAGKPMGLVLVNGDNNNIVLPPGARFFRITGPTAAFAITGIAAGVDGQEIMFWNIAAQPMTFKDQNASSTAANQLFTNTGADVVTGNRSFSSFIYDKTFGLWILRSHQN